MGSSQAFTYQGLSLAGLSKRSLVTVLHFLQISFEEEIEELTKLPDDVHAAPNSSHPSLAEQNKEAALNDLPATQLYDRTSFSLLNTMDGDAAALPLESPGLLPQDADISHLSDFFQHAKHDYEQHHQRVNQKNAPTIMPMPHDASVHSTELKDSSLPAQDETLHQYPSHQHQLDHQETPRISDLTPHTPFDATSVYEFPHISPSTTQPAAPSPNQSHNPHNPHLLHSPHQHNLHEEPPQLGTQPVPCPPSQSHNPTRSLYQHVDKVALIREDNDKVPDKPANFPAEVHPYYLHLKSHQI